MLLLLWFPPKAPLFAALLLLLVYWFIIENEIVDCEIVPADARCERVISLFKERCEQLKLM